MTSELPGLRVNSAAGRWVLAGTIAGSGMAMLDGTVVNVALARIGEEFGAGFSALQWITNAYTLALASLILIGGVLGDQFGRRRVFVIGVCWFTAASVLCALSPHEELLIASRALQGIGAALLTPGSLSIISASFAAEDRSKAVGTWSGLGGVATAIGPLLGGWLTDVNWRLVFLINVPLAALVIWTAIRHMPESRDTEAGSSRRIDAGGALSVMIMLAGLTYALTTAGTSGWSLPVVSTAAVAVLAGGFFVWWERRTRQPLVHLALFADRVFAVTNLVTVFVYAALSVFFFLLVLQLQLVAGWSPLPAGLSVLPVTLLMLTLSARFGGLSDRVGPRRLMGLGTLCCAAGFLLALRVDAASNDLPHYLADVLPAVALLGLGLSLTVAPLTAAVLGAAPAAQAGAASGINNAVARSAGLLAVAVVPVVAGLSGIGSGVDSAAGFAEGFSRAMIIGVGLMLAASLVSWIGLRRIGRIRSSEVRAVTELPGSDLPGSELPGSELPRSDRPGEQPALPMHQVHQCPVQCPVQHPTDRRPEDSAGPGEAA